MGVSVVVILSSRRSQLDLLKIQQRSSGICTLRGTNYLDQGGGGGTKQISGMHIPITSRHLLASPPSGPP